MALSGVERGLYQSRLTQAEQSYHSLMIGQSARVVVDQNGERVEYSAANAGRLAAYIAELKRLLGLGQTEGPMRVWF